MSVRATKRLIGEIVKVSNLQKCPLMVVQSVNEEESSATAIWFSDTNECQVGKFPVNALDRAEPKAPAAKKKPAGKKK